MSDIVVDVRERGVGGVQSASAIAFMDEGDGRWGQVGDEVLFCDPLGCGGGRPPAARRLKKPLARRAGRGEWG